jgi:DNA-binding NtrC family response regulator
VIERGVLWSRDATLNVDHLSVASPTRVAGGDRQPAESAELTSASVDGSAARALPQETDLTQVERSMIERAMREAGGNQTRAAQKLGISRDTLRYRLKKFGIQSG